jgi:hypothetical protein
MVLGWDLSLSIYILEVLRVVKFGKFYASHRLIFLNDVYGLIWQSANPTGQLDNFDLVLIAFLLHFHCI